MKDIIQKANFELAKIKKGSVNLVGDQYKYGFRENSRYFFDQFPSLEEVNAGLELFCSRKTNKAEGFAVDRKHLLKSSGDNFIFGKGYLLSSKWKEEELKNIDKSL